MTKLITCILIVALVITSALCALLYLAWADTDKDLRILTIELSEVSNDRNLYLDTTVLQRMELDSALRNKLSHPLPEVKKWRKFKKRSVKGKRKPK